MSNADSVSVQSVTWLEGIKKNLSWEVLLLERFLSKHTYGLVLLYLNLSSESSVFFMIVYQWLRFFMTNSMLKILTLRRVVFEILHYLINYFSTLSLLLNTQMFSTWRAFISIDLECFCKSDLLLFLTAFFSKRKKYVDSFCLAPTHTKITWPEQLHIFQNLILHNMFFSLDSKF